MEPESATMDANLLLKDTYQSMSMVSAGTTVGSSQGRPPKVVTLLLSTPGPSLQSIL